jgi:predicted permease
MSTNRDGAWLLVGGRLKPGVSIAAASDEIDALGRTLAREYPSPTTAKGLRLLPASSVPGNRALVGLFVGLLAVMVAVLMAVVCSNVSGILLVRATGRRREMAMRLSLGAGRGRLVRQLLTETVVLFVIGGSLGLFIAAQLMPVLPQFLPTMPFPVALTLAPDLRVTLFALGVSLIAALFSGLAPALQTSRVDPIVALKNDAPGVFSRSRLRRAFVVAQVALSCLLVISAGLFTRAVLRAGTINPGFDTRGVQLARIEPSMAGYTEATMPAFWRLLLERVRALPTIESATLAWSTPGGFEGLGLGLGPTDGRAPDDEFAVTGNIVDTGYFATLKIPFVAGRDFRPSDRAGAERVAIIGEAAARHFWPGRDPIGQLLSEHTSSGPRSYVVVGVVQDITSTTLIDGASQSFIYIPLAQADFGLASTMTLVTRSRGNVATANDIRRVVSAIEPKLPIAPLQTLDDVVALGLVPQRIAASLAGALGAIGLLLAALGVYGVIAFAVSQRLREFGIRMALGATRSEILHLVLRDGIGLTLYGCAAGVSLAALVGRVLSGFLVGTSPFDGAVFGGAVFIFGAACLVACYGPARRATSTDPLESLRRE